MCPGLVVPGVTRSQGLRHVDPDNIDSSGAQIAPTLGLQSYEEASGVTRRWATLTERYGAAPHGVGGPMPGRGASYV